MNVLEQIKFIQGELRNESEQLDALAILGKPPEKLEPKIKVPVMNELPAYSLKTDGVGSDLLNLSHGVAVGPPGETPDESPSIGHLLIGE